MSISSADFGVRVGLILFFLACASFLAVPRGFLFGNLFLLLSSVYWFYKSPIRFIHELSEPSLRLITFAFVLYVLCHATILAVMNEAPHHFEYLVPFLFFPFILGGMLMWCHRKVETWVTFFFAAHALAGVGGLLISLIQVVSAQGLFRAKGFMMEIPFGSLAVMTSTICFVGFVWFKRKYLSSSIPFLMVCGGFSALGASFLSGSKGGWISLVLTGPVVLTMMLKSMNSKEKFLTLFLLIVTATSLVWVPNSVVLDRFSHAWHAIQQLISQTGHNDGSLAPRLEIWKFAFSSYFSDVGWLGITRADQLHRISDALATNAYPTLMLLDHFHNDFIDTYVHKGYLGVFSHVFLYFVFAWWFWSKLKSSKNDNSTLLGLLGIVLLIQYVEFSMTDVVFQLRYFANQFVFVFACLVAFTNEMDNTFQQRQS